MKFISTHVPTWHARYVIDVLMEDDERMSPPWCGDVSAVSMLQEHWS